MSSFQSKEFLELQSHWYDKLKDDGYEDIEQPDGNLKLWAALYAKTQLDQTKVNAREEYYRLAGFFLNDHVFEDAIFEAEVQKTMWSLHSEGMSIRDIAKKLSTSKVKYSTTKINRTLKLLAKQMIVDYSNKNTDTE